MASSDGKRWRSGFILGSLLLHGLLWTCGAMRRELAHPSGGMAAPTAEFEVELAPRDETPEALAPRGSEPVAAKPGLRKAAEARVAFAGGPAEALPERVSEAEAGDGAEPADTAASSAASPHLNLAQLGVGDSNLFLDRGDPVQLRTAKAARLKRRLDRALAQGMLEQDVARGRGAGGPVLRSFEAAVYASSVPLNGSASFVLVIDSDGKLLSSSLADAGADREAWQRVARSTASALSQQKLMVPKGKRVRLTVAVTSHLELPSGADPGFDPGVLGIPIKKGQGPRSARVDVLNPLAPGNILTLAGDPADIGARPRRMVHAHVVSEELL